MFCSSCDGGATQTGRPRPRSRRPPGSAFTEGYQLDECDAHPASTTISRPRRGATFLDSRGAYFLSLLENQRSRLPKLAAGARNSCGVMTFSMSWCVGAPNGVAPSFRLSCL